MHEASRTVMMSVCTQHVIPRTAAVSVRPTLSIGVYLQEWGSLKRHYCWLCLILGLTPVGVSE